MKIVLGQAPRAGVIQHATMGEYMLIKRLEVAEDEFCQFMFNRSFHKYLKSK